MHVEGPAHAGVQVETYGLRSIVQRDGGHIQLHLVGLVVEGAKETDVPGRVVEAQTVIGVHHAADIHGAELPGGRGRGGRRRRLRHRGNGQANHQRRRADALVRRHFICSGKRRSSARLIARTFTRGSPRKPRSRLSVCRAIRSRTCFTVIPRALAMRAAWASAEAGLMCGSRPLRGCCHQVGRNRPGVVWVVLAEGSYGILHPVGQLLVCRAEIRCAGSGRIVPVIAGRGRPGLEVLGLLEVLADQLGADDLAVRRRSGCRSA